MYKHWTKCFILCGIVILAAYTPANAQDPLVLPTVPHHSQPPFVYHYDPVPPEVDWHIPAGWGVQVSGRFSDNVNLDDQDWHWETEWRNPGNQTIQLAIIFFGPNATEFPKSGILTLGPGGRYVFDFEFPETPETGNWIYTMTAPAWLGGPAFDHDCSVCEDPPVEQSAEWEMRPLAEIQAMDHIEVTAKMDSKPPAVSEWGLIIMALLLLTVGAIVIVRRRRLIAA